MEDTVVETEEKASDFKQTSLEEMFGEPSATESKAKEQEPPEDAKPKETSEEVKEEDKKEEPEPEAPEAKEETKAVFNWDDDANPYKQSANKFAAQYKNTRDWATKAYKIVRENGLEQDVIEDPEFVKEAENANNAEVFAFNQRETASYDAAVALYGKDYVDKSLYAPDSQLSSIIRDNPQLQARIFSSKAPVLEAIRIVKEHGFFSKYGFDVDKIPDAIRKEIETELRGKIAQELQRKLTKKEELPDTLQGVKSKDVKDEERPFVPTPLNQIFG